MIPSISFAGKGKLQGHCESLASSLMMPVLAILFLFANQALTFFSLQLHGKKLNFRIVGMKVKQSSSKTTISTSNDDPSNSEAYLHLVNLLTEVSRSINSGIEWSEEERKVLEELTGNVASQVKQVKGGIKSGPEEVSASSSTPSIVLERVNQRQETTSTTEALTITMKCPEMSETHSFRAASSLGSKWLARHPLTRNVIIVLCILVIMGAIYFQSFEATVYVAKVALIMAEGVGVLIGLAGYDVVIMKLLWLRFDFLYPMLLVIIYQVVECFLFKLEFPGMDLALYAFKVPEMVVSTVVFALLMLADSAVFFSITTKRLLVSGGFICCILLATVSHLNGRDPTKVANSDENQLCYSLVVAGCLSPYAISGSLMRTIAIFYGKMLVQSFRYPNHFMMIGNKVSYTSTTGKVSSPSPSSSSS